MLNSKSKIEDIVREINAAAEGDNAILTTALAKKLVTAINRNDIRVLLSSYNDAQRLRVGFSNKVSAVKRCELEVARKLYATIVNQDQENERILSKLSEAKVAKLLEDVVTAKTTEITAFYTDISNKHKQVEQLILSVLDVLTYRFPIGVWMRSIPGVGPFVAASIISYLDIHRAPCANHFWSCAGLNPEQKWEKNQLRPFNVKLKTALWQLGEVFVKQIGNPYDVYGKLYKQRKEYEHQKNEEGAYTEFAQQYVNQCKEKVLAQKDEYLAGRLPGSHIHSRAKRKAVKMFLAHVFEVWYSLEYKKEPPIPYAIAHQNHVHRMPAPNWDPKTRRILPNPDLPKGYRKHLVHLAETLGRHPSRGEFEKYMEEIGEPVIPQPPIDGDALVKRARQEDYERRLDSMKRIVAIFQEATEEELEGIDEWVENFTREFWEDDVDPEDLKNDDDTNHFHRKRGESTFRDELDIFEEDAEL